MADFDKTEPATPHKRSEARKKGQVARSIELNTAFLLIGSFVTLRIMSKGIFDSLQTIMRDSLSHLQVFDFSQEGVYTFILELARRLGIMVGPFVLIVAAAVVIANLLQVGFMQSWSLVTPQLTRLNPVAGVKKLMGITRVLPELLKSLLKILVTSYVSFLIIRSEVNRIMLTIDMEPLQSATMVGTLIYRLGIRISMTLFVIAALDFAFQKWQFEKSLRMSKQEIKDELIRYEGRPEVKARIRSMQRQVAMRRMMQEVPKADVIVTNPTHLAVALRYDPKEMVAPKVVAKGARLIAKKIIAIAKENRVPVIENKPLAQMLFKTVEIGQMIPLELYQTVADLLAFVWKMGKSRRKWF